MGLLSFLSNQLPAVSKADALSAPRAAAPVESVDEMPAHIRAKALEKAKFMELVGTLTKAGVKAEKAIGKIAVAHEAEFPILRCGGKNGASQLTYNNYRNWLPLIRNVKDPEKRLAALADKYARGDQSPDGPDVFWEKFYSIWLGGRDVSVTYAHKQACKMTARLMPDASLPTIHQVRYQVNKVTPGQLILGKQGENAFRNKCADYIERDWSEVFPGQCLVGDTRTFDTRVKVFDEEKQKYIAVRPNITGLMDTASWYLPAYWLTTEPVCTDTIIDTLRGYLAVNNGQPPAICHFDNGKDYNAKGFAQDIILEGKPYSIFRELGIELRNAMPYNARAKTIEPFFKGVMKEFDKLFPDYLGSTPAMRTMDAAWFDRHPEELPTLEQFAQIFAEFIRDYHKTPKHGKIHQGRSPQEIWNARPNRPALTPERLKMALLRPLDIRTVGRGPAVMMDGKRYLLDKLTWGEKVIVKSESIDPDVMHCFTLDGAYIGPARTRTMVSALAQRNDEEAKKLIAEGMARGRRQLIEAKSGMFDLTDGGHLMSILELSASSVVVDNTNGDSAGRLQTPPKKQITSVKGQQHSFSRQTLPEAFPPADDTEPPKPARKIHLAPSKVDRSLLKMVHSARHDNDDDDAQEQENLNLDRRAAEENTDMDGENLNLDCRAILADT